MLRTLIQDPKFRIVENIAKELIENQRNRSNIAGTEWETARNVAEEEGYVRGVNSLISEVYRLAQELA